MTAKVNKPRRRKTRTSLRASILKGNGTTFADFAKQKNPKHNSKRFLTVMRWFKDHGGRPAVKIDQIYTVYRTSGLNWPYNLDYGQVFRDLVKRQVAKRTEKGLFAITVAGESELDGETE